MIELKNICVKYSEQIVLNNLNVKIDDGAFVCVTGSSGAGKTTLFRLLMGLIMQESGEVLGISGKKISVVFQENRLCENISAIRNVSLVLVEKERVQIAKRHLCELLPDENLQIPVNQYSGGMKRRVAIARAMAYPSDVILLDEPFTGLDRETMEATVEYIKKYKGNRTVLCIAHKEEEIQAIHPDWYLEIKKYS